MAQPPNLPLNLPPNDPERPRLFPTLTGLAVNGLVIGATYFGVVALKSRYGADPFTFRWAEDATERFLTRRGVLKPRVRAGPTRRSLVPASSVGPATSFTGAPDPGVPIPVFGVNRQVAEDALYRRRQAVIQQALEAVKDLSLRDDPKYAGLVLTDVIEAYRKRVYDPLTKVMEDINLGHLSSPDPLVRRGEIQKFLDVITPQVTTPTPGVLESRLASEILSAKRRIVDRRASLQKAFPLSDPNRVTSEEMLDLADGAGTPHSRSAISNARDVQITHALWSQTKMPHQTTVTLNTTFESLIEDPAMRLGGSVLQTAPNRRALRKIIGAFLESPGVTKVTLHDIVDVGNGHKVVNLHVHGVHLQDPTRTVVSEVIPVPLLDEYGQFTPGIGQNPRASSFFMPESVLEGGVVVPGTKPGHMITSLDYYATKMALHAPEMTREMTESNLSATRRFRKRLYRRSFLGESSLIGQNIYTLSHGSQVRFGMLENLQDPEVLKTRVQGHQQYLALQAARSNNRDLVTIDIETVNTVPQAHPTRKVFEAEIYQMSAVVTDPRTGQVKDARTWWVHSNVPVSDEWAVQVLGGNTTADDLAHFKTQIQTQIRGGLDKATALKEMAAFVRGKPGDPRRLLVTHFGGAEGSDLPTMLRIAAEVEQADPALKIKAGLLGPGHNLSDPYTLVDTYDMARAGNRTVDQSFELKRLAARMGITEPEIEKRWQQMIAGDVWKVRGNATLPQAGLNWYKRQHQSIYDSVLTSLLAERAFLGENHLTSVLGDVSLHEHYRAMMGMDPYAIPAMLNLVENYQRMGATLDPELLEAIDIGGHPTSQMTQGIYNAISLQGLFAFGAGNTLRRGMHKWINTARLSDNAVKYLTNLDVHRGQAPGSTLWPYLLTDEMFKFVHGDLQKSVMGSHFFMATVAFANTPYVREGVGLLMGDPERLETNYIQQNYWIEDLPASVTETPKIVGIHHEPLELVTEQTLAQIDKPRHSVADGKRFTVRPHEWMIFEVPTETGIQHVQRQYVGPYAAMVRVAAMNDTKTAIELEREHIRNLEPGAKAVVGGASVTLMPSETVIRMGDATIPRGERARRRIDILMGWTEGVTKHMEHGRKAELIFGKVIWPVIEAARLGNRDARATLERMVSLIAPQGGIVAEAPVPTHLSDLLGQAAPKEMVSVRLATMSKTEQEALLEKGLTWQTIAELYDAVNKLDDLSPGTIPSYMKYGEGHTPELEEVRREMGRWQSHLEDRLKKTKDQMALSVDQKVMADLRSTQLALEHDLAGFTSFRQRIAPGKFKFLEHITQDVLQNGVKTSRQFPALVSRVWMGLGIKNAHEAANVYRPGELPETFDNRPSGGVKMRWQSIQLLKHGAVAAGLPQEQINTVMKFFEDHLAREQFPAVQLAADDYAFLLNNRDPQAIAEATRKLKTLSWQDIKAQATKITSGMHAFQEEMTGQHRLRYVLTLPSGDEYSISPTGWSKDQARQHFVDALGDKAHAGTISIIMLEGAVSSRSVDPRALHDTYLDSAHQAVLPFSEIPANIRQHLHLDLAAAKRQLEHAGLGPRRVQELIDTIGAEWGQPVNELRLPATTLFALGKTDEGGLQELSTSHLSLHNLLDTMVSASESKSTPQHYANVTAAFTNWVFEVARQFGGRRDFAGEMTTAFMPGIRGEYQSMSSLFANNPSLIASKYNRLHVAGITGQAAQDYGLRDLLASHGIDAPVIENIMEGKAPIPGWIMREPNIYTSSQTPIHVYVLPEEVLPVQHRMTTKTSHGAGTKLTIFGTFEQNKGLDADWDGDTVTVIMPLGSKDKPSSFKNLSVSINTWRKRQLQAFMDNQYFRTQELIVPSGRTHSTGDPEWLWRQAILTPGTNELEDIEYTPIPHDHPIMQDLKRLSPMDAKMVEMWSAGKRHNLDLRAVDDQLSSSLLARTTGPVTAATWRLRTAFDAIEQDASVDESIRTKIAASRRGSLYPSLRDAQGRAIGPGTGLITGELAHLQDIAIDDIEGRVIKGLSISKQNVFDVQAKNIATFLSGTRKGVSQQAMEDALNALADEKGRPYFGEGHARVVSTVMAAYQKAKSQHVLQTIYNSVVRAKRPHALETLEFLDILKAKWGKQYAGIDDLFVMRALEGELSTEQMMIAQQIVADEQMRGIGQPKFFARRSVSKAIADEFGMKEATVRGGFKTVGLASLALLGVNVLIPNQTEWFLGAPSAGAGGERYDYFGGADQLPRSVPLSTPEYTWDPSVHLDSPVPFGAARALHVQAEALANQAIRTASRAWAPPTVPAQVSYHNTQTRPMTTTRLRREHRVLEPFAHT